MAVGLQHMNLPMFFAAMQHDNPGYVAEIDIVPHIEERGTPFVSVYFGV